ncbi:hypothetical protein ACLOJK_035737 [Asimina triloba]
MGIISEDAIQQFKALVDQLDEPLKKTFENIHQGYPIETLVRFLKAREWNVDKAHKMLVDCLNWRIQNEIDNILAKPIVPADLYRAIRSSQLIGMSGYSKEGLPVFVIGVGLSTFDKASVHYYVQSHIQLNEYRDRVVFPAATKQQGRHIVDDLNYPEKTDTYYIVNAPYIFSACWKVVKPLLHERTRRKMQVLQGCGRDDLLKVMDYSSLPHFCRREGSGSSRRTSCEVDDCYSFDHAYRQQLYDYIKQQSLSPESRVLIKEGSFHVGVPDLDPEDSRIARTIESQFRILGNRNGLRRMA